MKRKDSRGSMPFSVIAVTILLMAAVSASVAAGYQRASDNADSVSADIDAVDDAVDDITSYINRGLGEIIYALSVDDSLGSLTNRAEIFSERAEDWIEYHFPMVSGGVHAECTGFDLSLVSVPMGLSSDGVLSGYTPTYLCGTGTVSVHLSSLYGKADTELTIESDGSYSLPLAEVRGSLFQSMAGNMGTSISQMMSSQLSAIAEYRIINGYGGLSAYGDKGTSSILTKQDVEDAYNVCIQAIAAVCFRDGNNVLTAKETVDLSDLLIAPDGYVKIDLAAVYAQALMSTVDDVALKWLDYLYGFEILESLYSAFDLKSSLKSLTSFLKGESSTDGTAYLTEAMALAGFSESDYRYPGSGITSITVGETVITVENPTADLLSQSWLKTFKHTYDSENDTVKRFVVGVLKSAAVMLSERKDLGTFSFSVNAYDSKGFDESLSENFLQAVKECEKTTEDAIRTALSDSVAYDEFYGCLADEVLSHSEDFVLEEEFESRLLAALNEKGITEITDDIVSEALSEYRYSVYSDLDKISSLKTMNSGSTGILEKALTWISSYGLSALDVLTPMEETTNRMVSEILAINGTNPYSGAIDLPGTSGFAVEDEDGNVMTEKLTAEITVHSPSISVTIDRDRCVHTVGFREDLSAAYSTVFVITLNGWIDYTVTSAGTLASAMGSVSSVYSDGFPVSLTIEVTAASGWALSGVDYEASNTLLTDLWEILLKALEPIMEPLRKILEAVRSAATALSEALIRTIGFVSEYAMKLYSALMDPLEELKKMMEDTVEELISEAVFNVLVDINLGDQSIAFEFFGCTLTLTTKAITWVKTTKTVLKAEISMPIAGLTVSAGFTAKLKGEAKASNLIITGFGGVAGDDWDVELTLDPLMKGSKYLFTVSGSVGDTDFSVVSPKLENYYEMGLALSDVPGIGEVIDNIPIPGLGINVGLDAGFSLRYAAAIETGLIINEFETNPKGTDTKCEWVELLNNGETTIDLDGYELLAASDRKTKRMTLSGEIAPGEYLVIYPTFTLVNSSGKNTKSGEGIKLYDADGNLVDETPIKADTSNDGNTWQRKFDGSTVWEFATGTEGKSNAGSIIGEIISPAEMKECVWDAVERAFGKVESITDTDSLVLFIQYLVRYTIEEVIGVVAAQIVDASVYVSMDVSDVASVAKGGLRIAFRTDGDLVKDCLKYLAGQVESLLLGMKNPYKIDPLEMFAENIDLEVSVHARVGFPELLSSSADLPEADVALVFRTNLSSLTRIIGTDTGDPEIEFGLLIRNCPKALIPSKLTAKEDFDHDLWLFKATITFTRFRCRGHVFYALSRWGTSMTATDRKIPTVLTAEELTEKAFRRASKIRVAGTSALDSKKKTALAKVTASGDIVVTALKSYTDGFPVLEKEQDFFPELADIIIGIDRYKKALGAVNWCSVKVEKLKNDTLKEIRRTKDPEIVEASRRGFYGRLNSYLDRISDELLFLQEAKNRFRKLPTVEPDVPTAVVAGFPNVGKSNLVTVLSTAEPEIAPYPFTTKGIIVGHVRDDWRKYQIIDTPGLLDREFDKRNDIEKQAVLALRYLTDVMIFVLDPSETCGFSVEVQEKLLNTVKSNFDGIPIIETESKSDVFKSGNGRMAFSALTGEGVEALTEKIVTELRDVFREKTGGAEE